MKHRHPRFPGLRDAQPDRAGGLADLNSPLRGRPEATRLKEASIAAAMSAVAVCQIGQSKAAGRVEHSRRKTALQDLKDHWSRAIKAKTSADALAELAHASLAAREAHGSDEYERRAIEIVEGPKPQRQDSRILVDVDRTRDTMETARRARALLDKLSPIDWTSVESGDRVRILPASGGNDGLDGVEGTVSHFYSPNDVREEVAVEIGDQVVWFPLRRVVLL